MVEQRPDGTWRVWREWAPGKVKDVVFTNYPAAGKFAEKEAARLGVDVQYLGAAGEARDGGKYIAMGPDGRALGPVTGDYEAAKALAKQYGGYVAWVQLPEREVQPSLHEAEERVRYKHEREGWYYYIPGSDKNDPYGAPTRVGPFPSKKDASDYFNSLRANEPREARRGAVKPLRWHRDKNALYARAANGTSNYRITAQTQRVSRRLKRLPWVLTLDSSELRSFEEVAQAKRFAEKHNKTGALLPTTPLSPEVPAGPVAPLCAPFTEVRIDEEKFRACVQLADSIGPITTPRAIYELLKQYCVSQPQEVFLVVSLDLHGHLRGIDEVARGQIDRVSVGIDDVMRAAMGAALARQAKGFAVVHCHPSGKATPSQADKDLTRAIEKARKPFGNNLKLVDHVVIGLDQFASIKQRKLFRVKA